MTSNDNCILAALLNAPKIKLNFRHPVKELIWAVPPITKTHFYRNYENFIIINNRELENKIKTNEQI